MPNLPNLPASAAQPVLPVQGEFSEDEGPAVAGGGSGGRRSSKGGPRELKRLQMWAWERRGRDSSSEEEEEEEEEGEEEEEEGSGGQRVWAWPGSRAELGGPGLGGCEAWERCEPARGQHRAAEERRGLPGVDPK